MRARPTEIRERLRRYFANRADPSVISVYLFGSFAEGRDHQDSDIDIGVLLDRTLCPSRRERFDRRIWLTSELISVLACNEVDVVILNDAPPLLSRKIVTRGQPAFIGDSQAARRFVCDVQLRAADLEPWLRKMARRKLAALAS